ncbi:MAG: transposase [Clostridia bacterium]|nr:transposase [Clostridia bacterium]
MPRYPRADSKTGIYHVMLRGNERKNIFIDEEDKDRFVETMLEKKRDGGFSLYAYCIMDNHVHMVIKDGNDSLERTVKRIGVSYAYYYNKKHKRVGHVFQDRFRSECIEYNEYLLSVIRYVHNNPQKAGICNPDEYKWSSCKFYLNHAKGCLVFPEIKEILEMFSLNIKRAAILFWEYSRQESQNNFIDMEEYEECEIGEEEIRPFINCYLQENKLRRDDLKKRQNRTVMTCLIKMLAAKTNLSLRRIADEISVSRELVRRVSKEPSP